jgi:NADH:ubiquinone oxidoreductase subunit 5 (subunit L)/multisubunit Na+/H+ antiporter MnhA subunit
LAGTFLLTIDAFVSGLLFLSAAYIAYAVGSDNLHFMSGFKSRIAHRSMEVGALALAGIPPLSGFWCTNWIQTVAWDFANQAGLKGQFFLMVASYFVFALLIAGAGITAFYGLRMMGLVFRGENDHPNVKNPPFLMRGSLAATLAITAFLDFLALLLIWPFNRFLLPLPFLEQLTFSNITEVLVYLIPSISTVLTCVAVAFGGYPAYRIYLARNVDAERLVQRYWPLKSIRKLLRNRLYINAAYSKVALLVLFLSRKMHESLEYGVDRLCSLIADRFLSMAETTYKYVETEGIAKPEIKGFSRFFGIVSDRVISLSRWAYPHLELGGFEELNYRLARIVAYFSHKIRRTHTGNLSYNMLVIPIGIILLALLLMKFGGIL